MACRSDRWVIQLILQFLFLDLVEFGKWQIAFFSSILDLCLRFLTFLAVQSRIPGQIGRLRRKRKACSGLLDDIHYSEVEILADGPVFVSVFCADVCKHFCNEGIVSKLAEPYSNQNRARLYSPTADHEFPRVEFLYANLPASEAHIRL